jgi:hypothetical protein
MAPWLIPIAMSVLQSQQKGQQEDEERKKALVNMHAQRAQSLGYPAMGLQGQMQDRDIDDEYGQRNYLAGLIPLLMQKKSGGM